MNLQLVSDDESLLTLCREIASEFTAMTFTVRRRTDAPSGSDADLSLWDFRPGLFIPEDAKWGTRHFALVTPGDVELFRATYPYAAASIVLKPVSRAVVRALIAQSVASTTRCGQSDNSSIRSDRDDILQCLMEANLRLQEYDAERTNFLGRALHDFHAPLTAVSGYCGLLLEEKIGFVDERQRFVINRMHHSVRRLSRMSRAMFLLSVGRHVSLKPSLREGDLRDCAEQALYEIQQLAEEKELQLDVDLEASCAPVLIDSGQMEQVFINLLENACKFSPRGGSILVKGYPWFWERRATNVLCPAESDRRVKQERTLNAYRIDIADSGPGILPEHLKSIFEEYVSYSGGRDRSRGGLGLAICRMILSQHRGRIWAENSRSGAVFSFALPLHRSDGPHTSAEVIYETTPTQLSSASL